MNNADLTTGIAIWGAVISTILLVKEFFLLWRNRRRIEFSIITAICYFETWEQSDIDRLGNAPGVPGTKYDVHKGDYKRAFVVLEFVVKNHYPDVRTIGRFQIDGWMFADKYTPGMYAPQRDYRVFDLHSREEVSLDKSKLIESGGSYGLRIEILDEVHDKIASMRAKVKIDLPTNYEIEFRSDNTSYKHEIEIGSYEQQYYGTVYAHQWSNLFELVRSSGDSPKPQ